MQNTSNKINSALKLVAVLVFTIMVTGCISAKSRLTTAAEPAEPAEPAVVAVTPEVVSEPQVEEEPESNGLIRWAVVAGNNLWSIAGVEEVYSVPEQWPLIYKANLDQIIDADLIYPGQVLTIPRDATQSETDAAINHAKTRGAWAVGPIEASDTEYLKNPG